METRIQKWGHSLAIRIPKSLALNIDIKQDEPVDLSIDNGKLVITPLGNREYLLAELLDKVSAENIHGEVDTGKPLGKEIW